MARTVAFFAFIIIMTACSNEDDQAQTGSLPNSRFSPAPGAASPQKLDYDREISAWFLGNPADSRVPVLSYVANKRSGSSPITTIVATDLAGLRSACSRGTVRENWLAAIAGLTESDWTIDICRKGRFLGRRHGDISAITTDAFPTESFAIFEFAAGIGRTFVDGNELSKSSTINRKPEPRPTCDENECLNARTPLP